MTEVVTDFIEVKDETEEKIKDKINQEDKFSSNGSKALVVKKIKQNTYESKGVYERIQGSLEKKRNFLKNKIPFQHGLHFGIHGSQKGFNVILDDYKNIKVLSFLVVGLTSELTENGSSLTVIVKRHAITPSATLNHHIFS